MTKEEINRIKYMVCCPLCDNKKCVRGTGKCEAEIWAKKRMKAESEEKGMIKEWYSNWECDDEIICPYCGKKYEPSYEETFIGGEPVECYKEGEQGEFTCDECGKKFSLSAEMKWEYTTETIEEEMTEEEHDEMEGKA